MAHVKKQIALFLSSHKLADAYVEPALELAKLLAKAKYTVIYGGSDHGLMEQVADTIQSQGGNLIGITTTLFEKHCRPNLTKTYHTATISVRTQLMITKADAVVVLSGGIGTLQELATAIELKKLGLFSGVIVVLNTGSFWNNFKAQLELMKAEKSMIVPVEQLVVFLDKPSEVAKYLESAFQKSPVITPQLIG